jgi:GntR family transcriptional regulator
MKTKPVSRNNYYPVYIQIKQILLDRINNGVYEYGQLLPAETTLAREFSVTRVTLRRALEILRQEEILESKRGIGWEVIHRRIEQKLTSSYWFGLEVGETGTATSSKIIKSQIIELPKELEPYFNDTIKISMVYSIVRLRMYNNSPISLEYSYIPEPLALGIDEKIHKNESIVWLMEHTYGIEIGKSIEYLAPQVSGPFESNLLEIPLSSPVFETTRITYSKNHDIVEVRKSIISGDKVIFRKDFP